MKKLISTLLGVGSILAVASAAQASPVTSSWNFNVAGAGNVTANSATYTGTNGELLNVYAYSNQTSQTANGFAGATAAGLDISDSGLGVYNGDCERRVFGRCSGDSQELDNANAFDFIVLELPTDAWLPLQLAFTLNTFLGDLDGDDYEIWGSNLSTMDLASNPASFDTAPTKLYDGPNSGAPLNPLDMQSDVDGLLLVTEQTFRYIYISGVTDTDSCPLNGPLCTSNNDDLRVAGFQGSVASLPEPGALALLGLGLVGLVAARRRRVA